MFLYSGGPRRQAECAIVEYRDWMSGYIRIGSNAVASSPRGLRFEKDSARSAPLRENFSALPRTWPGRGS